MSDDRAELSIEERLSLTPAESELVRWFEAQHDPSDDDGQWGDLPYDDVLDEHGNPIR